MTTPSQQYVYVQNPQAGGQSRTAGSGSGGQSGSGSRTTTISGGRRNQTVTTSQGGKTSTQSTRDVRLPEGVPKVLANENIIFGAWIAAMIIVAFDEWHNYRMLPRPSRFWYTSLTFGILTLLGMFNAILPLANALAVGFTIMLLWQYYNGSGQFSKTTGAAS